tara:strand:- start:869 stop:1816 length:948 start_codon:yes stop_codon:yes gene_type:complete
MNELKKYYSLQDTQETLLTVYIYNKTPQKVIPIFEKELERAKNINNPNKKHKICNRYFNLITKLKELNEDFILSHVYLIHDEIIEYKLTTQEINIINEYNIKDIYFDIQQTFQIDYLEHLFYNFDFIYTLKLNKSTCSIQKINKYKQKIVDECKIISENEIEDKINICRNDYQYKDLIVIYGESVFLNKINITHLKKCIIKNENMNNDKIININEKYTYGNNLASLEKKLNDLQNPAINTDLYVFGNIKVEIKEAIESYLLKELYIEERKIDILKNCIEPECFNFKIIPIRSLENGDIGSKFIEDYKGLMGIKYY